MPNTTMIALQEDLEISVNRQNELLTLVTTDNVPEGSTERDFTTEEEKEFNTLETTITELKRKIETQKKRDEIKARNAAMRFNDVSKKPSEETKVSRNYSILRAIKLKSDGKPLDGIEAEMQQEAEREARDHGQSIEGISMPSFMMDVSKRDLTVGTAATAGNLVATDLGGYTAALKPRLKAIELGAQVLSGLVGNLDLPIGDALASAAWEGENDTTAETTPSTTKLSLTPNRLAAFIDLSKQLMIQSSVGAENWTRDELSGAIARAVDLAIINGSGASNQPEGILNKTGIGDVAIGTNGGTPTYAHLVELETLIATANADVSNMSYLTTPGIRGYLKTLALSANNAGFTWQGNEMGINGYNADVSTQVPSTLTKGTASGSCHAVIFGNWQDCVVANWGTVDILVNPYTKAKEGLVELVVNSYWDVGIKHGSSFAAIKDALTS